MGLFYLSLFSDTSDMFQVRLFGRRLNERFLKVCSGLFVLLYPSDVTLFDYCPITVCPWLFLLGFAMFDNVPISPYILDVETVSLPSLVAFLELVVMLLIFKTWHDPLNWHLLLLQRHNTDISF